jgi:hypothetical protein
MVRVRLIRHVKLRIRATEKSSRDVSDLPRSGYTEQPRALALGQVVSESALKVAPDIGRAGGIRSGEAKDAPRPPLSGRISRYA